MTWKNRPESGSNLLPDDNSDNFSTGSGVTVRTGSTPECLDRSSFAWSRFSQISSRYLDSDSTWRGDGPNDLTLSLAPPAPHAIPKPFRISLPAVPTPTPSPPPTPPPTSPPPLPPHRPLPLLPPPSPPIRRLPPTPAVPEPIPCGGVDHRHLRPRSSRDDLYGRMKAQVVYLKSYWCSKSCGVTSLSLLSVVVSLFSLYFALVDPLHRDVLGQRGKDKHTQPCIECDYLVNSGMFTNEELLKRFQDSRDVCCVHSMQQMGALVHAMLKNQQKVTEATTLKPPTPPVGPPPRPVSAHVSLHEPPRGSSDVLAVANSMSNSRTAHTHGVQVTQSGIKILRSGLYMVYSNVAFSLPVSYRNLDKYNKTMSHSVDGRITNCPAKNGTLMRSYYTYCGNCTDHYQNLYVGGVFRLLEETLICVKLSYDNVKVRPEVSYLGLVMLQEDQTISCWD